MRKRIFSLLPALVLALGVGVTSAPAGAASVTLTPSATSASSAGEVISVQVNLNLVGAETVDAAQLGLAFDTNQTIFTISPNPLTGANGTNVFNFNQLPNIDPAGTSPSGFDEVRSAGFNFGGAFGAGTYQLASFDLVATGTPGVLVLFFDPPETFYSTGGTIQENFSGNAATLTFVPEPSLALLLGPALFGMAFLRGRSRRA